MLDSLRFAALVLVLLTAVSAAAEEVASSRVTLERVSSVTLEKTEGRVDQVLPVPAGGYLTRDYDWTRAQTQAIELFDAAGKRVRKIGEFGRGPGTYFRLKEIALGEDGKIWVADVQGRLSFFDLNGKFIDSLLIQLPGYRVRGVALDEERGRFYLTGCLPLEVYLNDGCQLVHQYNMANRLYEQSFVETDAEALEKSLLPLEDYRLDVGPEGKVFFTDAPLMKLFRADPTSLAVDVFPIRSEVVPPRGALLPGGTIEENQQASNSSFLIDRVLVSGEHVLLSIRKPFAGGFLLQVFDVHGTQLGVDLDSSGQLVGEAAAGQFLFATKKEAFEVATYELKVKKPGP